MRRALTMRFARRWWRFACVSQDMSIRFDLDGRGMWLSTFVCGRRVDDVLFVRTGAHV